MLDNKYKQLFGLIANKVPTIKSKDNFIQLANKIHCYFFKSKQNKYTTLRKNNAL